MSDIIGLRFKRNKYGLSLWEDRIKEVMWHREYTAERPKSTDWKEYAIYLKFRRTQGFRLVPKILGINTLQAYDLNEIIVYND